jgi:two-component system chemotaxis sensor kinase CheA
MSDDFTGEAEELLDALSRGVADFEAQGSGVRPELVNKIFRDVHSLKGLSAMVGQREVAELAHALEDMLDRLRMGKIAIGKAVIDLLYDGIDAFNRLIAGTTADVAALTARVAGIATIDRPPAALDEIALEEQTRKSLTEYEEHRLIENIRSGKQIYSIEQRFDFSDFDQKLRALTGKLTESGEVISTLPSVDPTGAGIGFRLLFGTALDEAKTAAVAPEAKVTSLRKAQPAEEGDVSLKSASSTVRVDIAKLDVVMNTIGELLIEKNQIDVLARGLDGRQRHALAAVARNLERKLNELQKTAIELRMVPVGQIYTKLSRSVRKLARDLDKDIELVLRGEETELDKMLVEEISDPLLHIIRNALDHGIESAAERKAAGKDPKGRVTVQAYQQGNSVVIDVRDDGRGIDPEVIREAGLKRGLTAADPFELLFAPGFSTAAEVSEISGRGVGLDVVKKNIQELKGSIEVISAVGEGTTFRIMLPITLAIIQALIVRAAGQQFAIPLTSVEESLRIQSREILTVEAREVLSLRDLTLPLVRLADAFSLPNGEEHPDRKLFVVVTRSGEKQAGIVVDGIVRQHEIVIKSIGERLKGTPGIAGATELGRGEIVLVVDVASLIEAFGGKAREARIGL